MKTSDELTLIRTLDHPLRLALLRQLANEDLRVQELAQRVDAPMNLVSYHLGKLRASGLVRERRSIADGRDLYYRLELPALQSGYLRVGALLHPTLHIDRSSLPTPEGPTSPRLRVLFLCTHNSARSQMAEAILRDRTSGKIDVHSAGTQPTGVHLQTVEVLEKLGLQTAPLRSKSVDELEGTAFDYIITVCDRAREECPVFGEASQRLHWSLPDPVEVEGTARERRRAFHRVAEQLQERIETFLVSLSEGSLKPT